jgi:hypothetical protein
MNAMKRAAMGVVAVGCLLATLSISGQETQMFSGEIIDSQCAALGGHQIMIQKGESEKDCTVRCVKLGGKYALFDASSKMAYQLDDQKKASEFPGMKVKVTGTYNTATKSIHVTDIKPAS